MTETADRRGRTRRRHDRWRFYAVVLAIALNLFAVALLAWGYRKLQAESRRVGDQHEQLIEACQRLQTVRLSDNASHYADYLVFRVVYVESKALGPRLGASAREDRFQRIFLAQLQKAIEAKTWVPRTDCRKAINEQGVRYRSSAAVRFADELPGAIDLPPPPLTRRVR